MAKRQIENMERQNFLLKQKGTQEEVIANRMLNETIGQPGGVPSIQDIRWGRERDEATQAKAAAEAAQNATRVSRALETTAISSGQRAYEIQGKELTFQEARARLEQLKIPEAKVMAEWFNRVGEASPAAKAVMDMGSWIKYITSGRR